MIGYHQLMLIIVSFGLLALYEEVMTLQCNKCGDIFNPLSCTLTKVIKENKTCETETDNQVCATLATYDEKRDNGSYQLTSLIKSCSLARTCKSKICKANSICVTVCCVTDHCNAEIPPPPPLSTTTTATLPPPLNTFTTATIFSTIITSVPIITTVSTSSKSIVATTTVNTSSKSIVATTTVNTSSKSIVATTTVNTTTNISSMRRTTTTSSAVRAVPVGWVFISLVLLILFTFA